MDSQPVGTHTRLGLSPVRFICNLFLDLCDLGVCLKRQSTRHVFQREIRLALKDKIARFT
jgi:hypothetical protein